MKQRKDVQHLGYVWVLEGRIMTEFRSRWDGCVLAKNLKLFWAGCIRITQGEVDLG